MASVSERARYLLREIFGVESDERSSLRDLLLALQREGLGRGDQASATFAIHLYLVLFARYPRLNEIAQVRFGLEREGAERLVDRHLKALPFQDFLVVSERYRLKLADPSRVLVDVTHTSSYPFNSGIQRVVRSLVGGLLTDRKPMSLFYMEGKDSRPALLADEDLDKITNWEKYTHAATTLADESMRTSIFNRVGRAFMRQLLKFPLDYFIHSLQWSVEYLFGFSNFGRSLAKKIEYRLEPWSLRWSRIVDKRPEDVIPGERSSVCEVLVFREPVKFLIPELPIGHYVEFYLTAKAHLAVTYSIVVYDLIPLFHPEFCAKPLKTAFLDYVRMFRVVDRMSCISQDVARQIKGFSENLPRKSPGLIETHYLGCNIESEQKQLPDAIADLERREDVPVVLCVGTFEPRKNGITLLRAAMLAQSRGLKFKVIFAGNPGWMMEEFLGECEEALRQGFKIECLGHVSDPKLKDLYRTCHFSVFCSIQEGFGLPVVESLHYGKPCVVSDVGSMSEIAAHGGCLPIKDPRSFEELATALEKMLTDQKLYARLWEEAKNFRWPSWAEYASTLYDFSAR